MSVAAVVVAAGRGERLGRGRPKALVELAGRPLLDHALQRLRDAGIEELVVVAAPGHEREFAAVCAPHEVSQLVDGGVTRSDSVRAGVAAVDPAIDVVAVHDAARALTPPAVTGRVLAAVTGDVVAAAPGLPVPDTLKRVDPDGGVLRTLDRAGVWEVHTPQAVRAGPLREVLAGSDLDATDDLGLIEAAVAAGTVTGRIALVEGDPRDLKITYPRDLRVAEALLAAEPGWEA